MATVLEEEEYSGQLNLRLWWQVFRFARAYARYFVGIAVGLAVVAGAEGMIGLLLRGIVDAALHGQASRVRWLGAALGANALLIGAAVLGFIRCGGRCSNGISHDIRQAAFARLQSMELAYFDRRPVGWLMARLVGDTRRMSHMLSWGLMDLIWGPTLMIVVAAILLVLNWRLALIVFTVVPLLVGACVFFQRRLLHSSRAVRKSTSLITGAFNEAITGVRTTKTLVREQAAQGEFAALSAELRHVSVRNTLQSAVFWPITNGLSSAGVALALWFGGLRVIADPHGFSLATLMMFFYFTGMFFGPVHEIAHVFSELVSCQAAAERVMGLLSAEPAIKDSPAVVAALQAQRNRPAHPDVAPDGGPTRIDRIEFRHVDFAYKPGQPVLTDFNLAVAPGQTVALVGPTGGGKTTIVSLLCRFYEPTAGEVLINGQDYRERSLLWLQSNLGIVLQTPHLFSGTVRENIRYGRLDATDDQIVAAARLVNADGFIAALEKGYDSEVGQGGNRLSVGQRQLVSFARAVLANPQIFVMDEATSSVDTETEKAIQAGLAAVLRGRISFIIAHRLSTIRSADVIAVIDAGRIVERGNHHELIRRRGRYYELYTNQFTREHEAALLGLPAPDGEAGNPAHL